jgi:hypothetical protein
MPSKDCITGMEIYNDEEGDDLKMSFLIKKSFDNSMINDYEVIRDLGEGSFGVVKLAKKGEELFAIKVVNRNKVRKKSLSRGRK